MLEPAVTVTWAGTVSAAFVLESATEAPPLGAAALSVTVQVLEAFDPRLVAVQLSLEGAITPPPTRPKATGAAITRAAASKGVTLLVKRSFFYSSKRK